VWLFIFDRSSHFSTEALWTGVFETFCQFIDNTKREIYLRGTFREHDPLFHTVPACALGHIVFSNSNKMVLYCGIPARRNKQYRMIGECKKENPISFACLDVSYFQTTKMV
jgi:hypothetical protein